MSAVDVCVVCNADAQNESWPDYIIQQASSSTSGGGGGAPVRSRTLLDTDLSQPGSVDTLRTARVVVVVASRGHVDFLATRCARPFAYCIVIMIVTTATTAAEAAATRKAAEYAGLERTYILQPVVVENLGTMNASAYGFLAGLGQKISAISGNDRETCYLFKRISVLIQPFNTTLLHESFADENGSDD